MSKLIQNLLPCPFCGHTSCKIERRKAQRSYSHPHAGYVVSVRCNYCHAMGGTVTSTSIPYAVKEDVEEEAKRRWNQKSKDFNSALRQLEIYGGCNVCKHKKGDHCEFGGCNGGGKDKQQGNLWEWKGLANE